MSEEMKAREALEREETRATQAISATVAELLSEGVETASLCVALAAALGVVTAAAPRDMADALEASLLEQVKQQRIETWCEVDAAGSVH